jgi:hypothetical protein
LQLNVEFVTRDVAQTVLDFGSVGYPVTLKDPIKIMIGLIPGSSVPFAYILCKWHKSKAWNSGIDQGLSLPTKRFCELLLREL